MLIEREVTVPSATAEECLRFYENNRAKFRSEPIFEASHILIAAGPADQRARDAARNDAERLAAVLVEHPSEFATMARTHSACPSAAQGGNLGQLTRGSTVAEFERCLTRMEEGQITSAPVESRFGFHIIRWNGGSMVNNCRSTSCRTGSPVGSKPPPVESRIAVHRHLGGRRNHHRDRCARCRRTLDAVMQWR